MKKLLLIAFVVCAGNFSFGSPLITVTAKNGDWNSIATWDLYRTPNTTDIVIIPLGSTVTINSNLSDGYDLTIKVFGVLRMAGGILQIGTGGSITVYNGGSIVSTHSADDQIRIGNTKIFQGSQGQNSAVVGPQQAIGSMTHPAFEPFNPLPVKFVGLFLTRQDKDILIQWSTSEEINADMFNVERSYDGLSWKNIAYVAAVGNSAVLNNYSFADKNIAAAVIYYRIKETDINGVTSYTAIKCLKTDKVNKMDVKIASVQHKVLIQFFQDVKGPVLVRFISLGGQVLDQQTINQPAGQIILNSKVNGNCLIYLTDNKELSTARQVVL